ncbi:MAG: class I SAM-dependent methyltransferase [Sedimentisphaerales bacterium]|nr:class I SAM-dependent methyltransferase [Sedimentisphaerales bacterium]
MCNSKNVSCCLCGNNEYKLLFKGQDRLHGKSGLFEYVICNRCGLIYMNPQINADKLSDYYPNDYAPHHSKKGKSSQSNKKMRKKNLLPENILSSLNEKTKILDVGCGNGKFLDEVKKMTNAQVYGLDFSQTAIETAKSMYGLDIVPGVITKAPFERSTFDLITAWQYLEHVPNPLEVLEKFQQLLKPNGICILSIPNYNSMTAKIFKEKWYCLDCPRHLYIYTPETISKLMDKAGLEVIKIKHDPSSKNFIRSLQYYFYGNNYDDKYRDKIKNIPIIKHLISPFTHLFALIRKSDNIIVFAKNLKT